jgi:iron complex transport system ATP-binding protein
MTAAIEIRNLSFAYDDQPVLKNICLQIAEDRFTVILGKNGCGKSTLFKVLTGIESHKNGTVSILGENIARLSSRQRAKRIGYLPQQHRPIFPFSVMDVVLTGRASHVALSPKKKDRMLAEAAIDRVGIRHLIGRPFTELSGGEQQMAMIARVLAQEPKVILLDEPTSHLDIFNQTRILSLVRELVDSGLSVIAVLHDPNSAFIYGDEFVFIKGGEIQSPDPSHKPWDKSFLEHVYDSDLTTIPYGDRALVIPGRR